MEYSSREKVSIKEAMKKEDMLHSQGFLMLLMVSDLRKAEFCS
jgi:hypothetical protein